MPFPFPFGRRKGSTAIAQPRLFPIDAPARALLTAECPLHRERYARVLHARNRFADQLLRVETASRSGTLGRGGSACQTQ